MPYVAAAKIGMPILGSTLQKITPGEPDSSNVFQQGATITKEDYMRPIEAVSELAGVDIPEPVEAAFNPGGYLMDKLGGTVICTELNRQGLLSKEIRDSDSDYRRRYISDVEYTGYRIMASPVVWLLRKSKRFARIFSPIAIATATEMASRVNTQINGTVKGKVVLAVMVPICRKVGTIAGRFGYSLSDHPMTDADPKNYHHQPIPCGDRS
jgi:hypothetical protein